MKTLVVYYSRTGTTARLAHKISELLSADSERIVSKTSYDGSLGYWRGAFHTLNDTKVAIEDAKLSPAKYDLIIVGGPVWGARIANPVRTYLRQHASEIKSTAFFVTQGGPRPGSSFKQMATMSGKQPIATLSVSSGKLSRPSGNDAVRAFVEKMKSALAYK
jgi:menaquinone-dependent protoporphyrinogen IX oxidase